MTRGHATRFAPRGPIDWTVPVFGWYGDGWTGQLVAGHGHARRRLTEVALAGRRPWDDGRPLVLTLTVNDLLASTRVKRGRFSWSVAVDVAAGTPVRLSLTTDRTHAPRPDARDLGVILDHLTFAASKSGPKPRAVAADWARVLDLPGLGPDDDILSAGADSFGVTTLAAWYSAQTGRDLPETLFFEASTPRAFAAALRDLSAFTPAEPERVRFVPLQPWGDRRPVFVVPGGAGGAAHLLRDAQVAAGAGRERPVFGLWHRDRPEPLVRGWAEAAAAEALEQMRALGDPPWLIHALCGGAPIAWEIARLALARGDGRAALFLVDGAIPAATGDPTNDVSMPPLGIDLTLGWVEAILHEWPFAARWERIAPGAATVVFGGDAGSDHDVYTGRIDELGRALAAWADAAERRLLAGAAARA